MAGKKVKIVENRKEQGFQVIQVIKQATSCRQELSPFNQIAEMC